MAGRDQDDVAALPAPVQLLWGLPAAADRRGPKPSVTRDEIVTAAVGLADEAGLAAVSMARVAEQLGLSTMALYRYVATKQDLLVLMFDAGMGAPPPSPRRSWRTGLRRWAEAVHATLVSRPWLLQIPITGPPAGPNNLAWLDAGLRTLSRTALPAGEQVEVVLLMSTYVQGAAALHVDIARAGVDDPATAALPYRGALRSLLDDRQLPALTAAIDAGAFDDDDDDEDGLGFTVAVEIILDGVGRRIERAEQARR